MTESNVQKLINAIMKNDAREVKKLLVSGTTVNAIGTMPHPKFPDKTWETTPLLIAIQNRNMPIIELLFQYNADTNYAPVESHCHTSPLWNAVAMKDVEIARYLIEHGAKVNFGDECLGGSILSEAAANNDAAMVKLLLSHGALINGMGINQEYMTPLMAAAKHGHLAMMQLLLENGADPNVQRDFATALTYALKKNPANLVEIVQSLKNHGAELIQEAVMAEDARLLPLFEIVMRKIK